MAEIVAGFLGPAIDVVKWIGAPIKRQFTYLCCFSANITGLENEAETLQANTRDLHRKVDHATDDLRVISGEVEDWLKESNNIKDEMDEILEKVPTVESRCLKLGARFSLSRRAMKTTARSKEHREGNKFKDDDIAQPGSPAARRPVPSPATYEFESRKQIEEDIMTTLVGGDVNIMGICGMGGLGKTTMAERIRNKALKNNVFNEAVMVAISQSVDKLKIQLEIGRSLGLKKLEEESSESRRQKLNERLSGTKRILLVLDDVWEKLVLEEVGIPCNHKGCTILITSRNRNVFKEMNVQNQNVFGMKELSKEEAWILFRGKVGTCVDDNKLNCIAKDVVKKCKGLPLALTVVGDALKEEMDEHVWKNSLRELEQVEPDIPKYIEDVYNPLKLSYDFLRPKHKVVFLLCCLYPEDADIPIEHLTYFSMGLGIYKRGIEEARDWMYSSTRILINRSLLLDSKRGDDYVRMHDVVRDFCKFIAKQEGHDCTWISAAQRSELPTTFAFPNLRLLLIHKRGNEEFKLDNSFLEGIKYLYVLSIEGLSLTSLPSTTQSLKSLKILVLDECRGLETLSTVGELVNLEILICRNCDSIEELPPEMKELNRLKLLDLSGCENLQRIGGGIISSLVALEELKMLASFNKWEEGENARLRELEELKMLRWLEIHIENPSALAAAEKMELPSKLDRFHIKLSGYKYSHEFDNFRCDKKLELKCEEKIYLGHWIETQFLPHTEALSFRGNVELAKCEKLRYLELVACETIKECFITPMDGLEHLKLSNLPKLEKMWDDDQVLSNSFQNLKILKLSKLPVLKHFGNDCLPQLEDLRIENCEIMEHVFLCKGESQNSHHITKVFPKLKKVGLKDVANLTSFYQGIEDIEFPQLTELRIRRCAKMKSLVSKGMGSNENNAHIQNLSCQEELCGSLITSSIAGNLLCLTKPNTKQQMKGDERSLLFPKLEMVYLNDLRELESFCEWKFEDELPSLRDVRIWNCPKMKQVWKSTSILQTKDCLPQLKLLHISKCKMMEQVFLWKEEHKNSSQSPNSHPVTKIFPKLEEVYLGGLPQLTSFYQGIEDIEFPQLKSLGIRRCAKMTSLVSKGMRSNENNWGGSSSSSNANIHNLSCQPHEGLCGSLITSGNLVSLAIPTTKHYMNGDERSLLFPKLETLSLEYLRELESFCEWKCEDELPSLREVTIYKCPKMKQVWKSNSIRQHSQTKDCLPQLEVIWIGGCKLMEQVFLWKEEHKNSSQSPNFHPDTKMFPKLEKVSLRDLPKLTSFYQGIEGIEFPQLRTLEIERCENMRNLVSKGMRSNENNWGGSSSSSSSNANIQNVSCQPQEVLFACLEDLTTDCNPYSKHEIDISFFYGLKKFKISGYEGNKSFITSSIARNLCNLTILTIEYCREMTHVITNDEKKGISGGESTLLQFPKLEELILTYLPKLISFCEWKCDIELPSLREVEIRNCPNMKNLTLGSLNAPNLESFNTDIDNYLQVPFSSTKKLKFSGCYNPLNCDKIDVSHFNGLGELAISKYIGSMSFFPSSITRSLVNLTTLTIEECYEMVKVIEDEEEKENVGSSGQRRILFPQLQRLRLKYLSKLVSFCEWKCDVELPSLMEVDIRYCRNMKRFTLGYLATPKLECVWMNYKHIVDVKDLNGMLQQEQIEKEEEEEENDDEKDEEEEDDGEEGQERKGEIEEEQN